MDKEFKIKKKGNFFVAFDTVEKDKSYGKININTGQCIGGTLCFDALRKHLAAKKVVVKESFTVWMIIEKHTEFADGTEKYEDLKESETRSGGRFSTLEEAEEQMEEIASEHQGDFTK